MDYGEHLGPQKNRNFPRYLFRKQKNKKKLFRLRENYRKVKSKLLEQNG